MIKTVLFDLDGTLLNTIDDLADAGNWVCAQNGWPTFTVAQFKLMVGNGIPKLVERFSPADARTPAQLAATLAQFTARYDAHKEDKTAPYPGIPALLDALKAEGIQCAKAGPARQKHRPMGCAAPGDLQRKVRGTAHGKQHQLPRRSQTVETNRHTNAPCTVWKNDPVILYHSMCRGCSL